MLLQLHRRPAQLCAVRARLEKMPEILQTTFSRRLDLSRSLVQCARVSPEFICIFKLTRHFLRALHIKFVHLAPTVFELGKIRGIQVQLRGHLHLAVTKAFSGGHEKFAFLCVGNVLWISHASSFPAWRMRAQVPLCALETNHPLCAVRVRVGRDMEEIRSIDRPFARDSRICDLVKRPEVCLCQNYLNFFVDSL